jgi:hypothetical protein
MSEARSADLLRLAKQLEADGADVDQLCDAVALALGWESQLRPIETSLLVWQARVAWRRGDMSWTASGDVPPRYAEDLGRAWTECERLGWLPSVKVQGIGAPRRYEGCCWTPAYKGRAFAGRAGAPAAALVAALLRAEAWRAVAS